MPVASVPMILPWITVAPNAGEIDPSIGGYDVSLAGVKPADRRRRSAIQRNAPARRAELCRADGIESNEIVLDRCVRISELDRIGVARTNHIVLSSASSADDVTNGGTDLNTITARHDRSSDWVQSDTIALNDNGKGGDGNLRCGKPVDDEITNLGGLAVTDHGQTKSLSPLRQ